MLSDPEKRRRYDLGGDPFGGGAAGSAPASGSATSWTRSSAARRARGPRPRRRRGQDALIQIEVELAEAAFGATRELQVDTAVICATCARAPAPQPGTDVVTCDMCQGRGDIQHVQRSFLGQVMTSRPCPQCRGYGTVIPHPCRECSGEGRVRSRRSLTVRIPAGVDTGTRIQLAGEGEVGPGGGAPGDLYVEILVLDPPGVPPRRRRPALHGADPDDRRRAGAARSRSPMLDGEQVDVDIRPGTQSGQSIPMHDQGVPHLRGNGRGDLYVDVVVETPTKLDDAQQELLRRAGRAARRGASGRPVRARAAGVLRAAEGRVPGPVTAPVFVADHRAARPRRRWCSTVPRPVTPQRRAALRVGERVVVTDGRGTAATGRSSDAARSRVVVAVERRETQPAATPRVTVVQAIPKGDRAELAVELMTEVGVDAIVPLAAARCVARWGAERAQRGAAALARDRSRGGEAVPALVVP